MIFTRVKYVALIIIGIFTFQSCSEDSNLSETDISLSSETLMDEDNALIIDWTDLLLELDRYATGMRPTSTARALAYIHLAAYEAGAPGSDNMLTCDDNLISLGLQEELATTEVDYPLAINTAYAKAMDHFILNIPENIRDQIAELEEEKSVSLSSGLTDSEVQASIAWGDYVAETVIAFAETDEAALSQLNDPQPLSYEPPTGEGFWTYSAEPERALFPYWGEVRSFVIGANEASTVEPIPYSENPSSAYFAQMQEVVTSNDTAREGEGEGLWIAEFWSDDVEGLMMSPPGRQYSISNQLIEQFDMNLEEALILNVKLGFSLNDAAVATWNYKYQHMVMRPNVYIHEFIDPDFQTNLFRLVSWPNPSFPGYPSGHSTFASAAAGVFIQTFGNDVEFTDNTHAGRTEFQGQARSFSTLSDMAAENAYSRIPLGVHIRMDCDEGLRLGYEIADAINAVTLTAN